MEKTSFFFNWKFTNRLSKHVHKIYKTERDCQILFKIEQKSRPLDNFLTYMYILRYENSDLEE